MQFVPFLCRNVSLIWKMKIINGYCLVFQMVYVIIDKGIQTLMMKWISYCQQQSVALWYA